MTAALTALQPSSPSPKISGIMLLQRAAAAAVTGGTAGALAMVLQVVLLMWLRTVINCQYKHAGLSMIQAFRILYKEGGIGRFYQGAFYALLQGPLSRFGDTAANEGVRDYLADSGLSVGVMTLCASVTAAAWRVLLTPLDTVKTTLQVSGASGMSKLQSKIAAHGPLVLFDGAVGNYAANVVGHYPWFVVHNALEKALPPATQPRFKLLRRAFIGCCSAIVSDCCSNGVRVLKTYKQTSDESLSYLQALKELIAESGVFGFMVRGLGVKLISNVLSSILFSVLWKMIMEQLQERQQQTKQKLAAKKS
jgi:Mitochondrial carrier protein